MSGLHDQVLAVAIGWSLLLVLGFLGAALRGGSLVDRLLAVDGAALCLVALLAMVAYREHEAGYLDAALAIALLAFVGTLAAARFRGPGGPL